MIILLVLLIVIFVYILVRQLRSYYTLKKCGFNTQFDIFGWKGLQWLDSSNAHWNISEMSSTIGDETFAMLKGAKQVIVTNDADLIHSICTENYDCFHARIPEVFAADPVKSKGIHVFAARGERWKRLRTLTSYGLSTIKLKLLFPTIEKCIFDFLDHVKTISDNSDKIVIDHSHSVFQSHTSYVLVQCAYGSREPNHRNNKFLNVFSNAFGLLSDLQMSIIGKIAYILPEIEVLFKNNFVDSLLLRDNKKAMFLDYLLSLISKFGSSYIKRKSDKSVKKVETNQYSLLEYFYEHNMDINNGVDIKKNEQAFGRIDMKKVKVEKTISTQEIAAQCRFLSVAGFDTTANTLTLLFYFLAHNQDIQSNLYDMEICNKQEPVTYETISSLSFLQNCIFETLRLFPHASPLQHRVCTEKCKIGKYEFQEDFQVIINPWGLHHDSSIWGEDVNCFNPSRFENLSETQKRAFMPFGVGPRQCVGMRFALIELKTTVFRLMQKYKILPNGMNYDKNGKMVNMTVRDTGTIWPSEHIGIILEKR